MVYDDITDEEIASGEPIKTTTLQKIKGDFEDHEDRLQIVEASTSSFPAIILRVNGSYQVLENILKTTVNLNISILGVRILIDKAGVSGETEIDILRKRGGGAFESIFGVNKPKALYSSGDNYLSDPGELDETKTILQPGDILRLDIESAQQNAVGFLVRIDWTRSAGNDDPPSIDPTFSDQYFEIFNQIDITKKLNVDLSNISTESIRTITMADHDVDLADIKANTLAIEAIDETIVEIEGDIDNVESELSSLQSELTNLRLRDLADVSDTAPEDGSTIMFDSETGEYVSVPLVSGVNSVNGQTGAVVLDSKSIERDKDFPGTTINDSLNSIINSKALPDGIGSFVETVDSVSTGDDVILPIPTNKIILTDSGLNSIAGIEESNPGAKLLILNKTGSSVTVKNLDFVADEGQEPINTGTGANLTLPNNGCLFLSKGQVDDEWNVIGGSSGGGGVTFPIEISQGGTGETTKTAGLNALSPTTDKGDILVFNGTNVVKLPVGSNGQVLTADSAETTGLKYASPALPALPKVTILDSGSGTFNFTGLPRYVEIEMVGGGGGGGGAGSSGASSGGDGTDTEFGPCIAHYGSGGGIGPGVGGTGAGGGFTVDSPAYDIGSVQGSYGQSQGYNAAALAGIPTPANGASSFYGGGGAGRYAAAGLGARANTGSGGGGGCPSTHTVADNFGGGGGGAGGFAKFRIDNPVTEYPSGIPYTVGSGGSAGGAGSNGTAGGTGAAGKIKITEYY